MSKNHGRTRSVGLILIGLMLGAVTIAPAFANHTPKHTAKQIKKLNKKVKSLPTTSAVQQSIDASINSVVEPFAVFLDANGEKKTLVTHGPLKFYAECVINDGNVDYVRVYGDSTAAGWWDSYNNSPANNANSPVEIWSENTSPSGSSYYGQIIDEGSIAIQDGGRTYWLAIDGETMGLGLNIFGHKCYVSGHAAKTTI